MQPDYFLIPQIVALDPKVKPLDGFVYATVYWFSQLQRGRCIASNERIAEVLKSSAKSVGNSLLRLEQQGYIKRVFLEKKRVKRGEIVPLVRFSKVHQLVDSSPPTDGPRSPSASGQKEKRRKEEKKEDIFVFSEKLLEMELNATNWMMPVIAYYWGKKGWEFQNREQYQRAMSRECKFAQPLKGDSLEYIRKTIDVLAASDFEWNLGTVAKWIDKVRSGVGRKPGAWSFDPKKKVFVQVG